MDMILRTAIILNFFLMSGWAFAQTILKTANLSNGSGTTSSTSYKLKGTLGQPVSGNASSSSYLLLTGFEPGSSAVVPKFPDLVIITSGILPLTVAPGQATAVTFT